eukprot:TRINITY_DN4029_c0_g3_i2.p2 TRINITY_DN4029_c0_g3~~TRINITY_DN4029_c0_g3_i2.p2  ORF type:complete len:134 (-),score=53.92 TRINITY_DN4029_c0_g3_i2:21-422(-)
MNEESKEEEKEMKYLLELQSFEQFASEGMQIAESSESESEYIEESDLRETQSFVLLRAESMSPEEYKDFVNARATKILHRGKEQICKWLEVSKEVAHNKALIDIASLAVKLSLIHICRCRRYAVCRSRWSPYH